MTDRLSVDNLKYALDTMCSVCDEHGAPLPVQDTFVRPYHEVVPPPQFEGQKRGALRQGYYLLAIQNDNGLVWEYREND